MKEKWKDIEGYEGLYQISNKGNVKSLNYNKTKKEKLLKSHYHHNYKRITLYKDKKYKSFFVHVLVAKSFIPNPNNLPQVNHKDENRENNVYTNLEWCTEKYNCNYGNRNKKLSKIMKKGTKVQNKIQKTRKLNNIGRTKVICITTGKIFNSLKEAGDYYGFNSGNISKVIKGERKYCGKLDDGTPLKWKYL